jgi:hypothetical protein
LWSVDNGAEVRCCLHHVSYTEKLKGWLDPK